MDNILLLIMIITIIGGIVGLIIIVKEMIKNIDEEYKNENIISFLLTLIGFIIYCVNVGKNEKLAKSCLKMALFGFGFSIILISTVFLTIDSINMLNKETNIEISGNNKIDLEGSLNLKYLENKFEQSNNISKFEIEVKEKIIYIKLKNKSNINETKKELDSIFRTDLIIASQYDYNINIDDKYFGICTNNYRGKIIWLDK